MSTPTKPATAADLVNLLNTHHGETEALRRLIRFLNESAALSDGLSLEEPWDKWMMAPLEWSGQPAIYGANTRWTAGKARATARGARAPPISLSRP